VTVRLVVERGTQAVELPCSSEHVTAERVAIGRAARKRESAWMDGDVLVVPVYEEVMVAKRTLMLKEVIRLHTQRTTRVDKTEVPVRRERAIVERRTADLPGRTSSPMFDRTGKREIPAVSGNASKQRYGTAGSAWRPERRPATHPTSPERNDMSRRSSANDETLPDAIALLMSDHQQVKDLFERYKELVDSDADDQEKESLAGQICTLLTVHAVIEEEIFYPAARDALREEEALLEEALVEHQSAKDLIASIQGADPSAPSFDAMSMCSANT
jgi:hypothetical protein